MKFSIEEIARLIYRLSQTHLNPCTVQVNNLSFTVSKFDSIKDIKQMLKDYSCPEQAFINEMNSVDRGYVHIITD